MTISGEDRKEAIAYLEKLRPKITPELTQYLEQLKQRFIKTEDLVFRDGTHISVDQIWQFVFDECPKRMPYFFNFRLDLEMLHFVKLLYLCFSAPDRLKEAQKKGIPIVHKHELQPTDPYFAAGGIPFAAQYTWIPEVMCKGRNDLVDIGQSSTSPELCYWQAASHAAIDKGIGVTPDLLAPFVGQHCYDLPLWVQLHRGVRRKIPIYFVDHPIDGHDKKWAIKYFTRILRGLVQEIAELAGKKEVTDEDLWTEIRTENASRRAVREFNNMMWSASVPPAPSLNYAFVMFAGIDWYADPIASLQVIDGINKEVRERVKHSVKGIGLVDDPVRLFICGITPLNLFVYNLIDDIGGVVVGLECTWNVSCADVKEEGDPFEEIVRRILSMPYTLPVEDRALWTSIAVKQSKADGIIFNCNWGCNYQASVARTVCDIVKKEVGTPYLILEGADTISLKASEQVRNRIEAFIEMLR